MRTEIDLKPTGAGRGDRCAQVSYDHGENSGRVDLDVEPTVLREQVGQVDRLPHVDSLCVPGDSAPEVRSATAVRRALVDARYLVRAL
ncbi:hypothetical protein BH18ACT9_BH18ACT9_04060 [soil metagenome]